MVIKKEKEYFLKTQFWASTLMASFARANVYESKFVITDDQKKVFKNDLFKCVNDLVDTKYLHHKIDEIEHINNIRLLQEYVKEPHSSILPDDGLKFGVAQKILNLYLKYLWCADMIKEAPPHFPLDRMVQGSNIRVNWTCNECTAEKYNNVVNDLCPDGEKAEWELKTYNNLYRK